MLNNYLLNPALSGIENYTDVRLGHRKQWSGLSDAPQTSFITANWSLGDQYLWPNPLSFDEKGDNPMQRNYQQHYTSSPAHHGMGILIANDHAAQINSTVLGISYAYHLQMNGRLNLSMGLSGGFNRTSINTAGLLMESPSDPALANATRNAFNPDLSIGTWLYGPDFFAGISVQQLVAQTMVFNEDQQYNHSKQIPHVFATAGYKVFFAEDFYVLPSVMAKIVTNTPTSVDANFKMGYRDRAWIGAGYRANDAMVAMAGVNISQLFNVTYSYDFTASPLNQVSNGSHELVIGLLLNNVYKVFCPQNMW
ncbi:hypothetical protein PBAL39_13427 [Pedobacter sp. BAL39]|nr:hypothetical protein PBAL39_13427 [Pedobacter sp. BAL39]